MNDNDIRESSIDPFIEDMDNEKLEDAIKELNLQAYRSKEMKEVFRIIDRVSKYELPLLLTGESGTGKTALAKFIFLSKSNMEGNFVHVNCSAIPENLMESELFGHEKGSFTGADKFKKGFFELANNGVILLDEIGDIPIQLQSKLLNVLQEQKFYRVGGTSTIKTNAQVIAATNQDLVELIRLGKFREDLYFRLNVIPIKIPSLRERKVDIEPLINRFLKENNVKFGTNKTISKEAMEILVQYHWPGNIRQLINVIKRFTILSKNDLIDVEDLPYDIIESSKLHKDTSDKEVVINIWRPGQTLESAITALEYRIIEDAINEYGTIREAARKLGIHESTLTRKRSKFHSK